MTMEVEGRRAGYCLDRQPANLMSFRLRFTEIISLAWLTRENTRMGVYSAYQQVELINLKLFFF